MISTVNVEVTRGPNENNTSALRRFTKRVQGAGILPKVRSKRYSERTKSKNVRRARTLSVIKKREERNELIKLGKISPVRTYGRKR